MRNVTISVEDNVLQAGRNYAKSHHLSLNGLIRRLLYKITMKQSKRQWLEECVQLMNKTRGHSHGKKWKREELYE